MGFSTSLVDRHNYLQALKAVGIDVEHDDFPAISTCPFCHKYELYIFVDSVVSSLWLSCGRCKKSGDIGQFASELWSISLPDTAKKFTELGLISDTAASKLVPHAVKSAATMLIASDFWEHAKTQFKATEDDNVLCRARDLGLKTEDPNTTDLIGIAPYSQVVNLCAGINKEKNPPLKLRGCNYFIVLPFYDMPGRITGFLLIQYDSRSNVQTKFVSTVPVSHRRHKPNAGYGFLLQCLSADTKKLNNHEIITNDIFWGITAQTSHMRKYGAPLPVAISYDGPEAESSGKTFLAYKKATRIFHSNVVTPALVARACNASGYIAIHDANTISPLHELAVMRGKTKTWSKTLVDTLRPLPEQNAISFISRLRAETAKIQKALAEKDFTANIRAARCLEKEKIPSLYGITVRQDGWWAAKNTLVTDALIAIEYIIHGGDREKIFKGRVTTAAGNTYTFQEYSKKITRIGLLQYVDDLLKKYDETFNYAPRWNHKALQIALTAHPPKILSLDAKYGWDKQNEVFRFATYALDSRGGMADVVCWPERDGTAEFDVPQLIPTEEAKTITSVRHEDAFTWAVFGAVAASLIAPIYGRQPCAVGMAPEQFEVGLRIAKSLTCHERQLALANKHEARGVFSRLSKENLVWPVAVHNIFSHDVLNNVVYKCFNLPLLVQITPEAAAVAPSYGWSVLAHDRLPDKISHAVPAVLPAFMQHVLLTRPELLAEENTVEYTVRLLHKWLLNTVGHSFNLDYALNHCYTPQDAHISLKRELLRAIQTEHIDVVAYPRHVTQRQNYLLENKQTVWLNRCAIDQYFRIAKSTAPNWLAIVDALKKDGLYLGRKTFCSRTGPLVPTDWFFGSVSNKSHSSIAQTG